MSLGASHGVLACVQDQEKAHEDGTAEMEFLRQCGCMRAAASAIIDDGSLQVDEMLTMDKLCWSLQRLGYANKSISVVMM